MPRRKVTGPPPRQSPVRLASSRGTGHWFVTLALGAAITLVFSFFRPSSRLGRARWGCGGSIGREARGGHDGAAVGGVPSFLCWDTDTSGIQNSRKSSRELKGRNVLRTSPLYLETTQHTTSIQGSATEQGGHTPHRACLSLHFHRPVYSGHMQSELADWYPGAGPTRARPRFVPAFLVVVASATAGLPCLRL